MSTAGPTFAGTGADDASVGTVTWLLTGNITADDGTFSTAAVATTTHYLTATNFGFSIPAGATINGIQVEWKKSKVVSGGAVVNDNASRIIKGGTIQTTDKSNLTNLTTTPTYHVYGSSADLWSIAWTNTDINASNFGAAISLKKAAGKAVNARMDACRITITYTVSGGSSAIKTVSSLVKTNIKTINKLAIASIKTIDGLA